MEMQQLPSRLHVCNGEEASACSVCPLIRELGLWEAPFILEFQWGWGAPTYGTAVVQGTGSLASGVCASGDSPKP